MKRGFVGVETVLGLVFVLMLGGTLLSVYQFTTNQPQPTTTSELIGTYHSVFERLRADFRAAVTAGRSRDTLTLTDIHQQTVSWALANGMLTRTPTGGQAQVLLSGLHSGGFEIASPDGQLVSIWLVPADSFAPPFFTSFALRGGKR